MINASKEHHWMTINRHFVLCLFVGALAAPYCLWLVASIDKPLWQDEVKTVALVRAGSFEHMFSAIRMGLDVTPPLYTGYGWLMWHYVISENSPAWLLRITNAALIGATLWILYLLVRRYFDQLTALITVCTFILLEGGKLEFLTLEVRTYAALVFLSALAIYASLRAIERPCPASLTSMMLAYFLLLCSHTFGVIYVISIASCAIAAAAAERNVKLALKSGLSTVPAIVIFVLWIPILRSQSQLGSWIPRPRFTSLLASTYLLPWKLPYLLSTKSMLALLLLSATTLVWRFTRVPRASTPMQWWKSLNRTQRFVVLLPIAFGASTVAVWIFSRFVFPVFVTRYFYPNMILHVIWLSVLVNSTFNYVKPSMMRYGLALAFAVLTGLTIVYRHFGHFGVEDRIPCFDPLHRTYLENPFKSNGVIVTASGRVWDTRQGRFGEAVMFPVDEDELKINGNVYEPYVYQVRSVTRFAEWAGVKGVMTTSELLDIKPDIMVLDAPYYSLPWLKYVQLNHRVKLTPLAKMKGCTLWRMETLR